MSHQVGLSGVDQAVSIEDFYLHDDVAASLSSQKPLFSPGSWGYHALTFGTLADELMRRTDGRTLRRFYDDELAWLPDSDFYMGLPTVEDARHAGMEKSPDMSAPGYDPILPEAFMNSVGNPLIDLDWPNHRRFREEGHPAAGRSGNARGLAKIYAALVCDETRGHKPLLPSNILNEAMRERVCGIDQGSGGIGRYGAGFRLNTGMFGASPAAFGHPGLGGSTGFADPARRLGIGYSTDRVLSPAWQAIDPRLSALLQALWR